MADHRVRRSYSVLAAGLLLALAGCSGGDAEGETAESSATSQDPQVQQEPPEDYAIDECLVGVWTTVSQREESVVNGQTVILIDVERQLSFASDGIETVTYLETPAAVTGGEVSATFDLAGQSSTLTSEGGSGPVTYTCSAGELTQSAPGYEAVFTRAV